MEERKIDVSNMTIDEAFYEMKYCEENGEHVSCRKGGHVFHSIDVTLDDMYETLTGMTREQFTKENAKQLYNEKVDAMRMEEKKPEFISRGLNLVYFENFPQWEKCVEYYSNNKYGGNPVEIALDIMEALNHGERLSVVTKMINSDSQKLNKLVEDIVFRYSKKGPDFKEYILGKDITAKDMKEIEDQRKKNDGYKKEDRKTMMSGL